MVQVFLSGLMFVTSGLYAAEKTTQSLESATAKKIIDAQQKNRETMLKTAEQMQRAVPALKQVNIPAVVDKPNKASLPSQKEYSTTLKEALPTSATTPPELKGVSSGGGLRDPFTTSGMMYEEMGRQSVSGVGRGFIPAQGMDNVPKMKLKGIINDHLKRGATALLEVEGAGVFLVRSGDEIGLQGIGRNQVLKVVKVDALRVEVQAGQINQVIIVR